jgi:hypothetical protein
MRRTMKPARRQRNKKKFAGTGPLKKPNSGTVKVKPKEEEPCSTKNPKPRKALAQRWPAPAISLAARNSPAS